MKPIAHPDALAAALSRQFYLQFIKPVIEWLLAFITMPIWLPLVGILALAMRLEGGRGFYIEPRIGRSGRVFDCIKIRTLPPSQSRDCAASKQGSHEKAGWFGRFLRRTSLDELPQFINVLKGEMALIGPRPVPPAEFRRYGGSQWCYLPLRPGISGLWQVSGRNAIPYIHRIYLDRRYFCDASPVLDLKIALRTFGEMFRMTGR